MHSFMPLQLFSNCLAADVQQGGICQRVKIKLAQECRVHCWSAGARCWQHSLLSMRAVHFTGANSKNYKTQMT